MGSEAGLGFLLICRVLSWYSTLNNRSESDRGVAWERGYMRKLLKFPLKARP